MCVLCGESILRVHWTDRRRDEGGAIVVSGAEQHERLRERRHRVALVNRVLHHYGLRLDDWSGSKYMLSDRKGGSMVVNDFAELWAAAAKLARRPLDPLDPQLIAALKSEPPSP